MNEVQDPPLIKPVTLKSIKCSRQKLVYRGENDCRLICTKTIFAFWAEPCFNITFKCSLMIRI